MKRLLQVLLVLLLLLLLAVAGALIGVHSYVQSAKGTARIQSELSRALNLPLEIKQASLGWGGIRLSGVRVVAEGQTYLDAPAFTTEYQLAPLLHREVVLRKMVLESPKIVWPKNAEGKWVLPVRTRTPKAPSVPTEPRAPAAPKEFQIALDTLEIKNGSIELLDEKGERFAQAEGVQVRASLATAGAVTADVTATQLSLLQNGPVFEQVKLPLAYAENKLTFPGAEGVLGGGSVRASLTLDTKAEGTPFDLQLTLERVELAHAIADPDWQIHAGLLEATLNLHGASHDFERGTGKGEIRLTQAKIESLEPLLRLIGTTCGIPELATLKLSLNSNIGTIAQALGFPEIVSLREASVAFELKKKETVIENLLIDGGDLAVSTKGTISQEGKLNLEANLNVSDALAKKLPGFVTKTMNDPAPAGRRGIAFNITGKNDKPKTNLVDKVLGSQIGSQFNDIVSSLFGGSKKKDKDADRPDEPKKEKKKKDKDKDKQMDNPKPAAPVPSSPVPPGTQPLPPAAPPVTGEPTGNN